MPHSLRLATTLLCTVISCSAAGSAFAVVTGARDPKTTMIRDDDLFPRPAAVRKQVRFWRKIFYEYPSTTVVVHDAFDPDRVVELIDYAPSEKNKNAFTVPRKDRDGVTTRNLKQYLSAAEHFAREGEAAIQRGEAEKRLFEAYRTSPVALQRLYKGEVKLRSQSGLADDFIFASKNAQVHLPTMEKIFLRYGVPTILTRLPFVESMFNLRARSKVGASGIWQFMPQTARHYIFVNNLIDERNSPEKSTKAAAQFLANNYRMLGSWPLAITAYNHGVVGMAKAVKKLGTKDIGSIVETYTSPSFGFASRSFYSEFLAAADSYDRLYRQKKIPKADPTIATSSVILQHPISVAQLVQNTTLSKEILASLNPCLLDTALSSGYQRPLPAFYEIKVPKRQAKAIKLGIRTFQAKRYARR